MKLAPIVVLCLAVSLHQATAEPLIFDGIANGIQTAGSLAQGIVDGAGSAASGIAGTAGSVASDIAKGASGAAQGAIGAATGITKGVIGVKVGIAAGLADKAAAVVRTISEKMQGVQNSVVKGTLQKAQSTLQQIQDNSRGTLQASEIAAKNAEDGLIELENKKTELIDEWAEKAKEKLGNASPETQERGNDFINGFVATRSEAIKQASDGVLETLEGIQEKANATAQKYHAPMNKLIEQVGKCSEIKASRVREMIKCGVEIQKDLAPLASAPRELAAVKVQLAKAATQNIVKDIKVKNALKQFREQSKQVDAILDKMVAQDQQNKEQNPERDDAADDDNQEEESDPAPPKEEQSEDPANDDYAYLE